MSCNKLFCTFAAAMLALSSVAIAGDDPRHVRHELMEGVGDAAKVIGAMLKGERDYDAAAAMESLETFERAGSQLGSLFPEGSETGEGTEAAPAIWEDRAGFEEALRTWQESTGEAIAAAPATLEEGKPVFGAIFDSCKGCHDNYRLDDD